MDIAVLSDIHGNFEAFQTCITYALEREINTFLFLGDYLGEFAYPQRTMEYLYRLKSSYDCIFIRGNKEELWLNHRGAGERGWKEYDSATGALYYTYGNLTQRDMDFFEEMETARVISFRDMEPITVCHGSPRNVNEKLLPDRPDTFEVMEQSSTRLILCGHTHIQRIMEHNGKTVINPGAVGVPLQSCGRTQFLILHENGREWREEFISLTYDMEKEIENFHAAGLFTRAPYWCRATIQLLRTGKYSQSRILNRAMEYCKQETGECIWPEIPEKYWEKAYEDFFGPEELQGQDCPADGSREDFPVRLETDIIYESKWLTLYRDKVKMPDGLILDAYHRVHKPRPSVCVVIANEQDRILLIRSKRYATGRLEWEVPAGGIEEGECAEEAARRECREETGCSLKEIQYLCSQNPANGMTDILIHYYFARVTSENGLFDENEVQEKRWVSKKEAEALLRGNGSRCGVSMFGLLYAMHFCM